TLCLRLPRDRPCRGGAHALRPAARRGRGPRPRGRAGTPRERARALCPRRARLAEPRQLPARTLRRSGTCPRLHRRARHPGARVRRRGTRGLRPHHGGDARGERTPARGARLRGGGRMSRKVLFLDRDGTLIEEPPDHQVDALAKVRLVPGVIPALLRLRDAGFRFVMVTNQDGLGTDSFPAEQFEECHEHVLALFRSQGIEFDEVFVCPHREEDGCDCRKPRTGLVTRWLAATPLDLAASAVVGDRATDVEFAERLGVRGLWLGEAHDGSWPEIATRLLPSRRRATVERRTRETDVRVELDLDAETPVEIATGIGFYDHMLEQVAKHGGFALSVRCRGDLHVDEHHTVEDTALALGAALSQALGDRRGIARFGFLLPMDESQARVALDLS